MVLSSDKAFLCGCDLREPSDSMVRLLAAVDSHHALGHVPPCGRRAHPVVHPLNIFCLCSTQAPVVALAEACPKHLAVPFFICTSGSSTDHGCFSLSSAHRHIAHPGPPAHVV